MVTEILDFSFLVFGACIPIYAAVVNFYLGFIIFISFCIKSYNSNSLIFSISPSWFFASWVQKIMKLGVYSNCTINFLRGLLEIIYCFDFCIVAPFFFGFLVVLSHGSGPIADMQDGLPVGPKEEAYNEYSAYRVDSLTIPPAIWQHYTQIHTTNIPHFCIEELFRGGLDEGGEGGLNGHANFVSSLVFSWDCNRVFDYKTQRVLEEMHESKTLMNGVVDLVHTYRISVCDAIKIIVSFDQMDGGASQSDPVRETYFSQPIIQFAPTIDGEPLTIHEAYSTRNRKLRLIMEFFKQRDFNLTLDPIDKSAFMTMFLLDRGTMQRATTFFENLSEVDIEEFAHLVNSNNIASTNFLRNHMWALRRPLLYSALAFGNSAASDCLGFDMSQFLVTPDELTAEYRQQLIDLQDVHVFNTPPTLSDID